MHEKVSQSLPTSLRRPATGDPSHTQSLSAALWFRTRDSLLRECGVPFGLHQNETLAALKPLSPQTFSLQILVSKFMPFWTVLFKWTSVSGPLDSKFASSQPLPAGDPSSTRTMRDKGRSSDRIDLTFEVQDRVPTRALASRLPSIHSKALIPHAPRSCRGILRRAAESNLYLSARQW